MGKEEVISKYGKGLESKVYVSRMISTIISLMISDFYEQTEDNLAKSEIKTVEDVKKHKGALGEFSKKMSKMIGELRSYLYENFYMNPGVMEFIDEGKRMIVGLFDFYMKNPNKFPKDDSVEEEFVINVKDYIAGMTDGFLREQYKKLVES